MNAKTCRAEMFASYSDRLGRIADAEPFADFSDGNALMRDLARELQLLDLAFNLSNEEDVLEQCEALAAENGPDEDDDERVGEFWNEIERCIYSLKKAA